MVDRILISYPPMNGMILICKDLCQSCCPTAAADNAKLHTVDYADLMIKMAE